MAYEPEACTIITIVLAAVAWASILLRYLVRIHISHNFSCDDIVALCAVIVLTPLSIVYCIASLRYGLGSDISEHSPRTLLRKMKYGLAAQLLYFPATYIIKLSFALTLSRVVPSRGYVYSLYLLGGIGLVCTIFACFWIVFFCTPTPFAWDEITYLTSDYGCKGISSYIALSLSHATWVLIADVTLGCVIPVLLLRGALMSRMTKFTVYILLGAGSVASLATVMRMVYTPMVSISGPQVATNRVILWSIVEASISIIATSASTWKPLIVRFCFNSSGSSIDSDAFSRCIGHPLDNRNVSWPTTPGTTESAVRRPCTSDDANFAGMKSSREGHDSYFE
ncbi:hypothetical protein ASPVEDRAFT_155526 [Aspergillus versicolor CBS 583.65]|uniref:Rhodopsin domain-containing protein n=1 Tax=Aspergillus versicolor CBS 583.65 TaxID=1036611 RepID=A0A1L9Q215_ASPVE|nr:uncharacterized protein ASPVEDRAFT_155526 [Aspergillus versicolor CBS 583.65]OJJ07742.1 hypothetical protein ASPVEDRAFT_155526 [Aspergillus versicolor CBS 583.65]